MFKIKGVKNYLMVVFLNAFTDLGHKIIIQNTVFKVYDGQAQIVLTAIVNALILLPFILLYSPSGFLADKFAKNKIMQHLALFAVFITLGITYSYYQGWFYTAFLLTFLLALQSAIYSPAKYGYIKELVGVKYISHGNGAIQAVTTISILSGIIFYTVLFEWFFKNSFTTKEEILKGIAPLGWFLVANSVLEFILASKLPNKLKNIPKKIFKLKRYANGYYLHKNIIMMKRKKEIFEMIIALGLFWSISQVVLAVFGEYAKTNIGITNTIFVQGVMALSGFGIVLGSIMASKFSRYYIDMGLVVLGAFGIFVINTLIPHVISMASLAVLFLCFGIFAGLLMVPLNAKIQYLSSDIHLGSILAGNNFMQNIFMFVFLALTTIFAYFGMDSIWLLHAMGIVAFALFILTFRRYYVMAFWSLFKMLFSLKYNFIYTGLENIAQDKAVLILSNHASWIDWFLLQNPIKRRINFLMDKDIYSIWGLNYILKKGQVIPISPKNFRNGLKEASKRLQKGRIVAMFPEGGITKNGKISEFHKGFELIKHNSPIVACYISDDIFKTIFARYRQKGNWFKKTTIHIYFSSPLKNSAKADEVRGEILKLKEKHETKQTKT